MAALLGALESGLDLTPGADRAVAREWLSSLPGFGPWTVESIAMRSLGDPDAFLPTDLGVRRGAKALGLPDNPKALAAHAERWRPWRSYATIRLWRAA
jgi:AraC family transcriptional regulator of adaptative response / DNA-3-methyladenine glycosylase II